MMITTSHEIKFFHSLGKLFYAIAASDKKVHNTEITALKKIVRSKWHTTNEQEDEYRTNLIFQIEFMFDWLVQNNIDQDVCFNDFLSFKEEHKKLFTMPIKKLIWDTANAVALAFSGKNKSEVIKLTKLKMNLLK